VSAQGKPIPLIAETGGQNAMIVDSSALAEQVVADVIASAFDSAGQRCSALRVLCLQEDVAERTLAMLKGALAELSLGRTDRLSTDIGPVITAEAKVNIERHIAKMREAGHRVEQLALPHEAGKGTFVAPTIIEIDDIGQLHREVFGPVLHVLRWKREDMDALIEQINATGYGLTFGLHTRLDETILNVTERVKAGNLYVNRNIIGAVVGVQPFGGRGLSGTGPKAGGPLYIGRLVQKAPVSPMHSSVRTDPALRDFATWLGQRGHNDDADAARELGALSALGLVKELPGPVGERNVYSLHSRGRVLLVPQTAKGLFRQMAAALAAGNAVVIDTASGLSESLAGLPASVASRVTWSGNWEVDGPFAGALVEGDAARVRAVNQRIARLGGPLVLVQAAATGADEEPYCLNWLVEEVSTSINTAAAGGNASLMTIG
jgi:RHH-type proline utilization regulon transcriptional repressor/proline dehydrogenase/delta 1-pyrroline-5-carboxylate dehydrogenase